MMCDEWQGPGLWKECGQCPFGLLCLGGRLHNRPVGRGAFSDGGVFARPLDAQLYLCPVCGCISLDKQPFVRMKCPARKLMGAWKGGWMTAYRQAHEKHRRQLYGQGRAGGREIDRMTDMEVMATHIRVNDPLYPECTLFIYLCEHCYQDPPTPRIEVSIYDPDVCGEGGPP